MRAPTKKKGRITDTTVRVKIHRPYDTASPLASTTTAAVGAGRLVQIQLIL